MFLGYAVGHDGKTYCMLNLKTRKVLLTCDVKWLHKVYMQKTGMPSQKFVLEIENQMTTKQEKGNDNRLELV